MITNVSNKAKIFFAKLNNAPKWIFGSLSAIAIGGIITIVVISAVVISAIIVANTEIVVNAEPAETTTLFYDLEEPEVSNIIDYLKSNEIKYNTADGGSTIIVPKKEVAELRMAIIEEGLVEDSYVGYKLFDKTNFGISEYVKKLNIRRTLEKELQRTIKSMTEINDAKVYLVFKPDEKPHNAAVHLRFNNGRSLNKANIESIQNLVASSVKGLTSDKVFIIDNNGKMLSEPLPHSRYEINMLNAKNIAK